MTNEEVLLMALNGAEVNPEVTFQPQNNKQAYLAYAVGLLTDPDALPEPRANEEVLMKQLCLNGTGSGGELPALTNPATAALILATYEAINKNGAKITGTMPNNGAVSERLTRSDTSYDVPQGYHDGNGKVYIETQEKTVAPTSEAQEVTPDTGKLLSKVVVEAAQAGGGMKFVEFPDGMISEENLRTFDIDPSTVLISFRNEKKFFAFRNGEFTLISDTFSVSTFLETVQGVLVGGTDYSSGTGADFAAYYSKTDESFTLLCEETYSNGMSLIDTSMGKALCTSTKGGALYWFDEESKSVTLVHEGIANHYFSNAFDLVDGVMFTTYSGAYTTPYFVYVSRETQEITTGEFKLTEPVLRYFYSNATLLFSNGKQHCFAGCNGVYDSTKTIIAFDEDTKALTLVLPENNGYIMPSECMDCGDVALISPGLDGGGCCIYDKTDGTFTALLEDSLNYRFADCEDVVFIVSVNTTNKTVYIYNKADRTIDATSLSTFLYNSSSNGGCVPVGVKVDTGYLLFGVGGSSGHVYFIDETLAATKLSTPIGSIARSSGLEILDMGEYFLATKKNTAIYRRSDGAEIAKFDWNATAMLDAGNGKFVFYNPGNRGLTLFDATSETAQKIHNDYAYQVAEDTFIILPYGGYEVSAFRVDTLDVEIIGYGAEMPTSSNPSASVDGNRLVGTHSASRAATVVDLNTMTVSVEEAPGGIIICGEGILYG